MTRQIPESDWKLLRQLSPIALERLCQRILEEIDGIGADSTKSYHQRYLDIYEVIQRRNKEIAQAFNDLRRSNALIQLAIIYSLDLLTEEELARFSPETRSVVEFLLP